MSARAAVAFARAPLPLEAHAPISRRGGTGRYGDRFLTYFERKFVPDALPYEPPPPPPAPAPPLAAAEAHRPAALELSADWRTQLWAYTRVLSAGILLRLAVAALARTYRSALESDGDGAGPGAGVNRTEL